MASSSEEGTRSMKSESKMAAAASEDRRILKMESEEDRKILMTVKAEEGRILKLKKRYAAASLDMLYPLDGPPIVLEDAQDKAARPAGKKTKKVLVKKLTTMTKAQIHFIRTMATHPCPTTNLPEDEVAKLSEADQHFYHQSMLLNETRLAYLEALIDQQERFGYAVDESEDEVTDDEGDDLVEGIKLLGSRI